MPKKRPEVPATDTEKALFDALQRLKDGKPEHPDLLKKARLKTLRINPSTVAKEAGRARTLIGYDGCAYPKVRVAILAHKIPTAPTTRFEDVNRKLREDNAILRQSVKTAMDRVAAMVRRLDTVEREAKRKIRDAERGVESAVAKKSASQLAGATFMPKKAVVLPIRTQNEDD
jgi:hypothetical protein